MGRFRTISILANQQNEPKNQHRVLWWLRVRPQVPQDEATTGGQVSRSAGNLWGSDTQHIRVAGGADSGGSSATQQERWGWLCRHGSQAGEDLRRGGGCAQVKSAACDSPPSGGADSFQKSMIELLEA